MSLFAQSFLHFHITNLDIKMCIQVQCLKFLIIVTAGLAQDSKRLHPWNGLPPNLLPIPQASQKQIKMVTGTFRTGRCITMGCNRRGNLPKYTPPHTFANGGTGHYPYIERYVQIWMPSFVFNGLCILIYIPIFKPSQLAFCH